VRAAIFEYSRRKFLKSGGLSGSANDSGDYRSGRSSPGSGVSAAGLLIGAETITGAEACRIRGAVGLFATNTTSASAP